MLKYEIMEERNSKEDIMIKNSHCESEKITCHAELVSASHDTEIPKQVRNDMKHRGQSDIQGDIESCYKTLSRICKFAYCSLTNSTLSQRERVCRKAAFTLAEVLITLGIIGVVAALTMPALIENHNRKVVETRLKKFYSSMNQAIQMAEKDYGSRDTWFAHYSWRDGEAVQKAWLDKYIIPYLNITGTSSITYQGQRYPAIHFADGSSAALNYSTADWIFTSCNIEKCLARPRSQREGSCLFGFSFYPPSIWNFEPYSIGWDGSEDSLKSGSRFGCYASTTGEVGGYCTKLIQYNGWKIPDDYPYRVKYK